MLNTAVQGQQSETSLEEYYQVLYKNQDKITSFIRQDIDKLKQDNFLEFEGEKILSKKFLPRFYEERDYRPAWSNFDSFDEAVLAIEGSYLDGLLPTDYHAETLVKIADRIMSESNQSKVDYKWVAEFDILLTDAIFLYAFHLYNGKTDPYLLDLNWNFGYNDLPQDAPERLSLAIEERTITQRLNKLKPNLEEYRSLMDELAFYRLIAENGGWGTIEEGGKIDPGTSDPRIPLIRKRLLVTNDLSNPTNMDSTTYDAELEKDIRSFQDRHGLDVDGVIGKGSFTALNIPVEKKIEMLRVNLERARWIMHNIPEDFLIVNIARFKAYVVKNNQIIHRTNVMVGKTYHKTPVFRAKLQYIEFNPTWTVPVSITRKEMIPKMQKDPEYLKKKNMVLLDASGSIVDQSTINFSTISANNFPYTVRQEPGPWNALGVVKFIFPNTHSVYLHDTPSKSLFSKANRTFSHGCIRTQNPLELASVLLEGTEWNRTRIDELVDSKETKRVFIKPQLDVFLLYWTTGLMDTEKIFYLPDVYDRDQPILDKLDQKVKSVRTDGI